MATPYKINYLIIDYLRKSCGFSSGSFSFTNLVLANAKNHSLNAMNKFRTGNNYGEAESRKVEVNI